MYYPVLITHSMLVLFVVGSQQHSRDYCQADYCKPGLTNVGCNPPTVEGGPECAGKIAYNADLTAFNMMIVHQHNRLRSMLATGQLGSFAPASRMPTLTWDIELARQAQHNARSCVFAHDQCRNTEQFRHVGQSIAVFRYTGPHLVIPELMQHLINDWWNEFNVTTQDQLDKFPSQEPKAPIGHFTQMISDRAWKIGCSAQVWHEEDIFKVNYLVCNYSFGNAIGEPVYVKGKPASGCVMGENKRYPGLCSIFEPVFSTPRAIAN